MPWQRTTTPGEAPRRAVANSSSSPVPLASASSSSAADPGGARPTALRPQSRRRSRSCSRACCVAIQRRAGACMRRPRPAAVRASQWGAAQCGSCSGCGRRLRRLRATAPRRRPLSGSAAARPRSSAGPEGWALPRRSQLAAVFRDWMSAQEVARSVVCHAAIFRGPVNGVLTPSEQRSSPAELRGFPRVEVSATELSSPSSEGSPWFIRVLRRVLR
mmetsp:Transcript_33943/g.93927  ORF Transcript_33943/g.93927 Transcript_33943/m.93927 type:complete len:217 (-) Transcript_33943:20-670(-)